MKKSSRNILVFAILILSLGVLAVSYAYSNIFKSNVDVSVIVPIYNVEKYLDECLNSIENQTKQDGVEIICVNDGSKDNSFEILKSHAKKDKRIKVISQENRGISAARNEGMKKAKGKYIMFVDSDDLIFPYAIEKAYNVAESHNVDLVKFRNISFSDGQDLCSDNYKYSDDESNIRVLTRNKNENPFGIWGKDNTRGVVWNKFWRRDFLEKNNLSFKEGVKYEDILFNLIAFPQLFKIVTDKNYLYAYRTNRQGSIVYELSRKVFGRLDNNLILVEELMNNRDRINFDDSDNYILESVFSFCYSNICDKLKAKENKRYYSRKYLTLIDNFIDKYNVALSKENEEKINTLRNLANA